ncbi:DNA-binding protein [Streptomyces sp. ML-6]|uniref:DNA-binding protein n=1 Tax=Streptomyces sp. ML-6 TaxID=2982693 RepID=UPI0024BFE741|nr:DNA-binding protein [Streptomyces sp. ML-6]MDK0517494.1 helix-turn-helix domain-containing protein [Streptomyces sp. ML-6]MDK0524004.1 helix-turn-helix domain-containing protein [Streptomyces sp. ML-6]MDK0524778.1 helix-turn-helix domain-containing protein [Streptomyces sp. ML-6]MDK0524884.1 helix-turn-helix domain-containing protein [Streptomyces sp. ML-6]
MIPRNRPVINEADVARRIGVPLATWRRRDAPGFRSRVPSLLPESRYLVYDLAQAEAYIDGKPIPALPQDEHPEDLLTADEAAAVLGINPGTVRAYAVQGYLSAGTTVYGARLWPRREVNKRRDNPPGQGKGGGRRAGEPQVPRKQHSYEGDPRLRTASEALAAANSAPKSRIAAELAAEHGGTPRTWERLLTAAAALQDGAPEARA